MRFGQLNFGYYRLLDNGERGVGAGGQPSTALQGQGGDGEDQLQALHGRQFQVCFEADREV